MAFKTGAFAAVLVAIPMWCFGDLLDEDIQAAQRYVESKRAQSSKLRATRAQGRKAFEYPAFVAGQSWVLRVATPLLDAVLKSGVTSQAGNGTAVVRTFEVRVAAIGGAGAWLELKCREDGRQAKALMSRERRLLAFEGDKSMVGADFFPIGLPLFDRAEAVPWRAAELPASELTRGLRVQGAYRLAGEDVLGDEAELIWSPAEPWPVYVKTSNGTAVVVERRAP